jgi:hypothetical protein
MMHGGRGPSRFLAMTSFRLVLLVLLALLLPLRGVSAMVLPCGPMPGSAAEAVVSSPHHQDAHRDHGHSEGWRTMTTREPSRAARVSPAVR